MAAAVLGSVPVVIVYALSLDYFISGMTTGAVKSTRRVSLDGEGSRSSSRACATTPPQPKHWTPDLSPELRESCRKAPADCRATAEQLAHDWSTDEQAFGALKAFAAACEAGDAPACEAVDTRVQAAALPRVEAGTAPFAEGPGRAVERHVEGDMSGHARGEGFRLSREEENPRAEPAILDWIARAPGARRHSMAALLACEYRLAVKWSRSTP